MSEFINNRQIRQEQLKGIIKKLHEGASVDEVRGEFAVLTNGVSATEIAEMEQSLVREGLPIEEIQRLCDVHASVFKGSIKEIHAKDGTTLDTLDEWHPINTFRKENRLIERWISERILPDLEQYASSGSGEDKERVRDGLNVLLTIDSHYSRKEHLIFPYMEKHDITAPPQVMWGVDDEIRDKLKNAIRLADDPSCQADELMEAVNAAVDQLNEMIFKEEEIMFPMVFDVFTHDEWVEVESESFGIGFTLLDIVEKWVPVGRTSGTAASLTQLQTGLPGMAEKKAIPFDAGSLLPEEINAILNTIPFDMTFVDANNKVKYFTQGKERIFDRPRTIIGREVKNCHPPGSVDVVERIVEDLMAGVKDHEDFWIKVGDKFVHIRYFAVRKSSGEFLGVLEVSQDIKPIQELRGEKRLLSE